MHSGFIRAAAKNQKVDASRVYKLENQNKELNEPKSSTELMGCYSCWVPHQSDPFNITHPHLIFIIWKIVSSAALSRYTVYSGRYLQLWLQPWVRKEVARGSSTPQWLTQLLMVPSVQNSHLALWPADEKIPKINYTIHNMQFNGCTLSFLSRQWAPTQVKNTKHKIALCF